MNATEANFDGGHPALDFLNTGPLPAHGRRDLLAAPATLLGWLDGAGLVTDGALATLRASPPEARMLLSGALRLREAIGSIVAARVAGTPLPEGVVMEVNRVLGARAETLQLRGESGAMYLAEVTETASAMGLLAPVAEAAARFLVEVDPARVRRCAAPGCGLWFLDTSRNGRRRWCSMARCGNRAKVAAHYRRHRQES